MHTVGLLVFPNFQALGLAVGSVFEYANILSESKFYHFRLVSEHGGPVMTSQTFSVNTERLVDANYDTLIVGGDNDCLLPSTNLLAYLRDAPKHIRRVASICTGAFVLAEAGLLEGKRATTHWFHANSFKKNYPNVILDEDRIFVVDGQIWTSAGLTAGIDLALAIVESDLGPEITRQVARKLVIYQRRGGGQSQFSTLLDLDAKTDRVQMVLNYVRENLKNELTIEMLAEVANLSPRQFSRIFTDETGISPAKAVERLRVEAARLMMDSGHHPIEIIARETGFGDRERMRQAFLRAFGQSPQAIQRLSLGNARAAVL
ncbi:Transcriptional regulator GlxA family, contains an amidase domain and an AraC-type DNA-binding HTH domain [Methylobacillus rhizosphaerae]|uniref:Transcriptional regulator GlxA family, contains an amidase domain and an AraC-type DNA-binding HTH domain n=1 Tax=Methylobacillus rhizosphaerae TaxID=551994 RepID=A0A239B2R4_9PROT|nr:GlxA family transcriptional regulator [Methylobacillus rhizosphaerae]SNS01534.1 Transcriptional regulator GlxA family, contains an amidase domain and an AraC-type DNA-binding HTH domain [Methylobacillus rhizosphaerae]